MPLKDLDTFQKKAASSVGSEVAVSAGAGSGKTRLLVGRYLYLLKRKAAAMSEIVAITFTEKAAAQMKAAVAAKALRLAGEYPEDTVFWRDISGNVHAAPISTIHSFCNGILRRYPVEAMIDPRFELVDDVTRSELIFEAVGDHIASRLDVAPDEMGVLVGAFGVSGLKERLTACLNRRGEMLKLVDTLDDVQHHGLERKTHIFIVSRLSVYRETMRLFHSVAPGDDALAEIFETADGLLSQVLDDIKNDAYDPGRLSMLRDVLKSVGRKGSKKKWETVEPSLPEVKTGLKELQAFIGNVHAHMEMGPGRIARISCLLTEEFRLLEDRLSRMKRERSCLDHDDTLIETWRLLRNNPSVLGDVSRAYRHILVDEFQDTDPVQMDILKMIAGNSAISLFTVGDPKQSIYRFRGADVAVYNMFVGHPDVEFKTLRTNYRSDPAVINFVNYVFKRIMGWEDTSASYEAPYSEMRPANGNSAKGGVDIVVFENGRGDMQREYEAGCIADKIDAFSQKGVPYSEMAVIFRKGTKTRPYEETFLARGIPYVNLTSGDPFKSGEAFDCGHLLSWLVDPHNSFYFTALLLSPFFNVSPEIIYGLKEYAGKIDDVPYVFLADDTLDDHAWFSDTGIADVRGILRGLLALRDRECIRGLLEHAFDMTGYTLSILSDPVRGELSLSVVDRILEAADKFGNGGGDLAEFARLLVSGAIASEITPVVEAREDAVNIMTIHKSKGLEFKVVFLADVTSRVRGGSGNIGIHEELGIGYRLRGESGNTGASFVKSIVDDLEAKKEIAESKRLFYVACTRAVEHLVISGGTPSKGGDPFYEKNNWMGWLHSALDLDFEGEPAGGSGGGLYNYERISLDGEGVYVPVERVAADSDEQEIDDSCPPLRVPIVRSEPRPGTPRHLSPTRILDYMECPAFYYFRHVCGLTFAHHTGAGRHGLGEQYGSFAHRVMERIPFKQRRSIKTPDRRVVASIIEKSAGIDAPASWRLKLIRELEAFTSSDLYDDITHADSVRRETEFGFIVDGVLVRGAIDLMYTKDGVTNIVDFKTDAVDRDSLGDLPDRYRFQLAMYGLAVKHAAYDRPGNLIIHYLSPGVSQTIPCTLELLEETASELSRIIAAMADGRFDAFSSDDCESCPFARFCKSDAGRLST